MTTNIYEESDLRISNFRGKTLGEMIWLVGSGGMSTDYCKVLKGLQAPFIVVGRGEASAIQFKNENNCDVVQGGIEYFLTQNPELPKAAIVSVGIEQLAEVTEHLLNYGVKYILLEKPGGLNGEQISHLNELSDDCGASVFLAYNRRFYSSVIKGQQIISDDGGVKSFHFEFTEFSHRVHEWKKSAKVLERWFLGNSSHVADLAFFFGRLPKNDRNFY